MAQTIHSPERSPRNCSSGRCPETASPHSTRPLPRIVTSAAALVESLRGLGYSPETAIADLIDNSIAAHAETIELEVGWNEGSPQVALLDDGDGMDRRTLGEALRFGGTGPASERTASDL